MNQKVCGDHALLQCFAEGTLSPDKAQAVKAHVAGCPECRKAVTEYKQIMWDLEHPLEIDLPPELEHSYQTLMEAWKKENQGAAPAKPRGSWLPSMSLPAWAIPSWATSAWAKPTWAAHSIAWTRTLPGLNTAKSLVHRTGNALVGRSRSRRKRRKGGGGD